MTRSQRILYQLVAPMEKSIGPQEIERRRAFLERYASPGFKIEVRSIRRGTASIEATVLRLIRDLRSEFGLTYLFISHDLSVVARMCDRVAIMYLGRIVEIGPAAEIFASPRHPYTRALLEASPRLAAGQIDAMRVLTGDPPSPLAKPTGCGFRSRCPNGDADCSHLAPELEQIKGSTRKVACLHQDSLISRKAASAS